jgi:hypothetical protein
MIPRGCCLAKKAFRSATRLVCRFWVDESHHGCRWTVPCLACHVAEQIILINNRCNFIAKMWVQMGDFVPIVNRMKF